MSLFDEAKKAAEGMAEKLIQEKTGVHLDLDGSDAGSASAVTDDTSDEETTDSAESSSATPTEANPLMDNVMAAAKNMAMPLIEEKLKMDLDGDGQIGK